MTMIPKDRFRRIRAAAVIVVLATLAACASPFRADVSRFQSQLPAPAGQTFAVVAEDPAMAGGIEFGHYAGLVEARLAQQGYTPTSPDRAQLLVRFDYGVDKGRERIRSTGGGGWGGGWGAWPGYGRFGGGWGGFGRFGGWGGPWRYGWYDPFFDNGGVQSYTVFTSGMSMTIDRRADNQRLFEGRAEAVSTSNSLQYLVPNLVEAMFTNFPGNSGETVRITVAPEKTKS